MRNQCLITMLAIGWAITACSPQPAALTSSDLSALRGLFPAWGKAVGSLDYEAAAKLLTEDFSISEAHQAPIVGRDSMLAWMRATWPKDMQQTWVVDDVYGHGDVAYVYATTTEKYTLPNGAATTETAVCLNVARRRPSGWQFSRASCHPIDALPADAPARP